MTVFLRRLFLLAVALGLFGNVSIMNAIISLGNFESMGLWDVLQHLPPDYDVEQPAPDPDPTDKNSQTDIDCGKEYDFGDAVNSHREVILENSNAKGQSYYSENSTPLSYNKSILSQRIWQPISLDNFIKELKAKLRSTEYYAKLQKARNAINDRLNSFLFDTLSMFGTEKLEKQESFISAMQHHTVPNLLHTIQHGNVTEACQAFSELQNMWPWEHKQSFLIDTYTDQEKEFVDFLGVDVLKAAELCLYSRPDFLQKTRYLDSIGLLERRVKEFHSLQVRGEIERLIRHKEHLEDWILKYEQDNHACRGQLAILHSILNAQESSAVAQDQLKEQIETAHVDSQTTAMSDNGAVQQAEIKQDILQNSASSQASAPNLFEQKTEALNPLAQEFVKSCGLTLLNAHEFSEEHQQFFQRSDALLNTVAQAYQNKEISDAAATGTAVLTRTAQELQITGNGYKAEKLLIVAEKKLFNDGYDHTHPMDVYDVAADFEADLKAIQFCYNIGRHAAYQIAHNIKHPSEFINRQVEGIKGWAMISTEILKTLALLSCGDPDMNAPIRDHDIVLHAAEQKFDSAAAGIKAVVDHISKMSQPEFEKFLGHLLGDAVVDTVGMKGLGKLKGIVKDAAMRHLSQMKAAQEANVAVRGASVTETAATATADVEQAAGKAEVLFTQAEIAQRASLKPLGRGSTGRTNPQSLIEQLAMQEIMSDPGKGFQIRIGNGMTDPRWPKEQGWIKMGWRLEDATNPVEIHYVVQRIENKIIAIDDFKFKVIKK